MEEEQRKNSFFNNLPEWLKNPFVLGGAAVILMISLYYLLPWFKSIDSPFTQYKPLPIDSTYITLDTTSEEQLQDTLLSSKKDKIKEPAKVKKPSADSSSIPDLFKLNTDYKELDTNEQIQKLNDDIQNDLFSKLILSNIDPVVIKKIQSTYLEVGIKSVLHIISSTAVEMLSDAITRQQLDILQAIEWSPSVQGIIISDLSEKVTYATNRKFMNQYLFELFPGTTLAGQELMLQEIEDIQFISMPVYHRLGKIGTLVLMLREQ